MDQNPKVFDEAHYNAEEVGSEFEYSFYGPVESIHESISDDE